MATQTMYDGLVQGLREAVDCEKSRHKLKAHPEHISHLVRATVPSYTAHAPSVAAPTTKPKGKVLSVGK